MAHSFALSFFLYPMQIVSPGPGPAHVFGGTNDVPLTLLDGRQPVTATLRAGCLLCWRQARSVHGPTAVQRFGCDLWMSHSARALSAPCLTKKSRRTGGRHSRPCPGRDAKIWERFAPAAPQTGQRRQRALGLAECGRQPQRFLAFFTPRSHPAAPGADARLTRLPGHSSWHCANPMRRCSWQKNHAACGCRWGTTACTKAATCPVLMSKSRRHCCEVRPGRRHHLHLTLLSPAHHARSHAELRGPPRSALGTGRPALQALEPQRPCQDCELSAAQRRAERRSEKVAHSPARRCRGPAAGQLRRTAAQWLCCTVLCRARLQPEQRLATKAAEPMEEKQKKVKETSTAGQWPLAAQQTPPSPSCCGWAWRWQIVWLPLCAARRRRMPAAFAAAGCLVLCRRRCARAKRDFRLRLSQLSHFLAHLSLSLSLSYPCTPLWQLYSKEIRGNIFVVTGRTSALHHNEPRESSLLPPPPNSNILWLSLVTTKNSP